MYINDISQKHNFENSLSIVNFLASVNQQIEQAFLSSTILPYDMLIQKSWPIQDRAKGRDCRQKCNKKLNISPVLHKHRITNSNPKYNSVKKKSINTQNNNNGLKAKSSLCSVVTCAEKMMNTFSIDTVTLVQYHNQNIPF